MIYYNRSKGTGIHGKEESKVDDLIRAIKKAEKVVVALTQLALSIGTLLAVIKMVVESLM